MIWRLSVNRMTDLLSGDVGRGEKWAHHCKSPNLQGSLANGEVNFPF